jgi:hypothetical protein
MFHDPLFDPSYRSGLFRRFEGLFYRLVIACGSGLSLTRRLSRHFSPV